MTRRITLFALFFVSMFIIAGAYSAVPV